MHFLDDSLYPENQEKLVIQAAPYGPEWLPGDADDLPLTMDEHVQAAVDCWQQAPRHCTSMCASWTATAPSACPCSTS